MFWVFILVTFDMDELWFQGMASTSQVLNCYVDIPVIFHRIIGSLDGGSKKGSDIHNYSQIIAIAA